MEIREKKSGTAGAPASDSMEDTTSEDSASPLSLITDWVAQLPYMGTPAAVEGMAGTVKLYVAGTQEGSTEEMSKLLLKHHGGYLAEHGIEFFVVKDSSGAFRNFGFLTVVDQAAADYVMSLAWPNCRGEVMAIKVARNQPGAAMHGGNLSSPGFQAADFPGLPVWKQASTDSVETGLKRFPHLHDRVELGVALLEALESERGQQLLSRAAEKGVRKTGDFIGDCLKETFGNDMTEIQKYMEDYNHIMSQVITTLNTHFSNGIRSSVVDNLQKRQRANMAPPPGGYDIGNIQSQSQLAGHMTAMQGLNGLAAMGASHMDPRGQLPDLAHACNSNAAAMAQAITQLNATPVGQAMHQQVMQQNPHANMHLMPNMGQQLLSASC